MSRALAGDLGTTPAARISLGAGAVFGVVLAACSLGVGLAAIGVAMGPLGVVVPAVLVVAGIAAFDSPARAMVIAFFSFPIGLVHLPLGLQAVEAAVLIASMLVIVRRLAAGASPLPWTPEMWWPLALFGLMIISTPGALDPGLAIKQVTLLAAAMILALAITAACRTIDDTRRLLGTLLAVGTGMALYGIQGAPDLQGRAGGAEIIGRAVGIFTNPNDLGGVAAMLLMVALGMAFGARRPLARLAAGSCALVAAIALILSFSRGAWTGTALAGVVIVVALRRARKVILVIGAPLVVAALAFSATHPQSPTIQLVAQRVGTFIRPLDTPYDQRPAIWREAFREIMESPLTGQGPGNFPVASARAGSLSQTVGAWHAHDLLLTVGAEVGLPAVAVVVAFAGSLGLLVLRTLRSVGDPRSRAMVAGVAAALTTQVGQGLVDYNFRNPVFLMLVWSLVGLLFGLRATLLEPAASMTSVTDRAVYLTGPAKAGGEEVALRQPMNGW